MCDVDGNGVISLLELETVVDKLGAGLTKKELHALLKILDVDRSGEISRNEFCRVLNKGAQAYKIEEALGVPQTLTFE
jgi:Ca2+-binding EF-hand superfamily protein